MRSNNSLLCPTDGVPINETRVRVVAGLVLLTAVAYLLTTWLQLRFGGSILSLLLVVDFGLRSFNLGKYSPFGNLADGVVTALNLPYRKTDQAPKRFAARIGLGFAGLITALHLAGVSALIPTAVLAVFAGLESGVGFCAGCLVYTFYVRLFAKAA